jgi:5-dehydro-4-deoxyglucarate dehydratase
MLSATEFRDVVKSGLLSFPVTPFDSENQINETAFCQHLEWLSGYDVAGLIVAGGTGELFSLTPSEVARIVRVTRTQQPHSAIIAGCGYGTKMAMEMAAEIRRAGADGILLLPHYLIGASADGIETHIRTVCQSTDLGVIVYNRGLSIITDTIRALPILAVCPPMSCLRRPIAARGLIPIPLRCLILCLKLP